MENKYFAFKKLFWSYTFCVLPISLLAGLLALFDIVPVYFNEAPQHGFKGFIIPIVYIPFIGLILSSLNWVILNFGIMLHNLFLKNFIKK